VRRAASGAVAAPKTEAPCGVAESRDAAAREIISSGTTPP
jgi:hypothetical protein